MLTKQMNVQMQVVRDRGNAEHKYVDCWLKIFGGITTKNGLKAGKLRDFAVGV